MMTNAQLAAARNVQNRYPDVTFRMVSAGIEVGGVLVTITANMNPEEVRSALAQQAANG
jgi:hypothetical protein